MKIKIIRNNGAEYFQASIRRYGNTYIVHAIDPEYATAGLIDCLLDVHRRRLQEERERAIRDFYNKKKKGKK